MSRIRRRKRRNRRIVGAVVGVVVVYLLAGFFVLPRVAKSQIETRVGALLGREVSVAKVRTNPLAFSVTLEGFSVKEPDGSAEFVGWERLYVNAEFWTSLVGAWRVREVALDGFRARAVVNPDGSLNVSDLLDTFAGAAGGGEEGAPAETKAARPVVVGSVAVKQASVSIADDSRGRPFRTQIGPLDFTLTDFHTGGAGEAPYRFAAVTEAGERLEWSGTLKAAPFRSEGTLRLAGIVPGKYAPYHAPFMQADVRRGTLNVGGRYEVDLAEGARVLRWFEGDIALRDMELVERASGRLVLALPSLAVSGIEVDAEARRAAIARVAIEGGKLHARREVDGTLNLERMARPDPAETPTTVGDPSGPAGTEPPAPAFALTLDELAVKGFAAEWIDLAAPWPAQADVTSLDLTVAKVTNAEGAAMPLSLALSWAPAGTVEVQGDVTVLPAVAANLSVKATGVSLVPLGPYVEGFVNARVGRGTLSTTSQARVVLSDGRAEWSAESEVTIDDLSVEDPGSGDEIAGFAQLALTGIQANPAAITVAGVTLRAPRAVALVDEQGALNLAGLMKTPAGGEGTPAPAEAPAPSAPAPVIELRRVALEGGDFRFADRSIQPNVRLALADVNATVIGLSSATRARGDFDLKASVDGVGPVAVTGRLDPLGPSPLVDLKVDFRNVDLPAFSPYSAKYAGYELSRGKLKLDVAFRMDGPRLDSSNVVTLDGFTFGAPSNSPEATKLPVRLAVALLKDQEGQIVIDVPVQGRTDDPEFRVGRVVMRVIVNLLTKAATSPFALLGSMFGGGGEELAFQEFRPGTTVLLESEQAKLATMIKALNDRPALNLAIQGSVDVANDAAGLRKARFETILRSRLGLGPEAALPDEAAYAAAVKAWFDEEYPPGTEDGTPLPPPPPKVEPPPPPEGVVARVIDTLSGRSRREQREAEEENARRAAAYATALEMVAAQGLPLETMEARLTERIEIGAEDLRALAAARAAFVRDYLVESGQIAPERLFLVEANEPEKATSGPRTLLTLQ
jgi:hypothetical protein